MNRCAVVAAALAVLGFLDCSSTKNEPTRIVRLPTSMTLTCADASGVPVDRSKCNDADVTPTTWVVDADAKGLSVATAPSGRHFDADPYQPGFTPILVGGRPLQVRATPTSDLVLVTLSSDDATGDPALAWIEPSQLAIGVELPRAPLPCVPIDLFVGPVVPAGGGDPVDSVVVAYDCVEIVGLAAFPVESRAGTGAPRTGERRWTLPAAPKAFSVRSDGAVAWVTLAGEAGDSVARVDLSKAASDDGAVGVVALDAPVPEGVPPLPGCPVDTVTTPGSLVLGAPVATPDGAFVYVPLARPASVAVLDDGLNRIDVNAPVDGVEGSGNVLFQRLGIRDLPMDAPARSIAMVTLGVDPDATDDPPIDRGTRALVALENGDVSRIVVVPASTSDANGLPIAADPVNAVPHRLEELTDDDGASSSVDSVALMPVLRVDGQVLDRGVVQNPEYPSFGSPEVITDPERSEKSVYYGIRFGGDVEEEPSEVWDVTYEGAIPGAAGCGLFEAEPDSDVAAFFRDPTADFCRSGVLETQGARQGDVLVVVPDPRSTCAQATAEALEYRIVEVRPDRLAIEPAFVSLPLPAADCFAELPLSYTIRASGSWTVVGSKSEFLHNRTSEGGACVTRPDADAGFNGRAVTTLPQDGGTVLQSCPLRMGDAKIGTHWIDSRFSNRSLSFNVVPGCRTDASFLPIVIQPTRDTRLTFHATSGATWRSVVIGGLPQDLVVSGTIVYILDVGTAIVHQVDVGANTVPASWY